LLYIAVSIEQYCDITHVNALPENEGILEVPSRLEISLGVQSDNRFVFDYENSHDMMEPILFADADFHRWS
jgi:hypothetical protein